jgi:tetratricopeptide (TPR) repeat protein
MLGLVRRVKDLVLGSRLRGRAERDPTPRSTLQLCAILQRQGRLAAAQKVARAGLQRFPYSLELQEILHLLWRRMGRRQLEALEKAAATEATPRAYRELVEFHLDGHDLDGALAAAAVFQTRFPDSALAASLRGRAHMARFHRDHVAEDGAAAIRAYQRALELEPGSTEIDFHLAETYYYIGVISKALVHLYRVLDREPGHAAGQRLQRILVRLPIEKEEEADLLRAVEESDEAQFRHVPERGPERDSFASGLPARVGRDAVQLSRMVGVRRVVFASRGQHVHAQDGIRRDDSESGSDPFADLAAGFRRTASLSAKRMGIGSFEEAELSWPDGRILAAASGPSIVVVETGPSARTSLVMAEARRLADGPDCGGGGSHG